ncbi:unnamed protein product, partial [Choristocarpus tenellus]
LQQAHTLEFLVRLSTRGWAEWGKAVSSATCVAEAVEEVVSGRTARALCALENPGRHISSPGCGYYSKERPGILEVSEREKGWPCGLNNIAIGALHAHHQW